MIPFFDAFVDTRKKRYHLLLLLFLIASGIMVASYLVLAIQLLCLHDYNSIYSLLDSPYITFTYISRVLVQSISMVHFTFPNMVGLLLENIHILEVIVIILLILAYAIIERKRITMVCLLLLVIEVLGATGIAYVSFQATSLQEVIHNLRLLGVLMLGINSILLCLIGYYGYRQVVQYHKALAYTIIEINEAME